jgi:hypothetical protein
MFEGGHEPRTAQVAGGGRFVHALQASVFLELLSYVKGVMGYHPFFKDE